MKFFMQLGEDDKATTETVKRHVYPSYVYGPFEDEVQARKAMALLAPNDKRARFLLLDGVVCAVAPSSREKPESEKRAPGDESNWKKVDDRWVCKTCEATVMAVQVAHPIHDGPFPMSGSGECRYEEVGYCPNCERKPNFHGAPVSG